MHDFHPETKESKMSFSLYPKSLIKPVLSAAIGVTLFSTPAVFANTNASLTNPAYSDPHIFVKLSEKVIPSVVNISVEGEALPGHPSTERFRKHFNEYFSTPNSPFGPQYNYAPKRKTSALGTGVIIEVDGNKAYVLTNHHVIENATKIQIQFSESVKHKKSLSGKVVGKDPALDLALIEVPVKKGLKLKALKFGDSEALRVGEYVMAVGNPFGQGHSVSHGIISAKGRVAPIFGKYLQTDAPINPGNSGGPLVNLNGEIIGINNAILARAQGIGFAIPSNSIKAVLAQVKDQGFVERGYLGIYMGQVSEQVASFTGNKVKAGQPFIASVETDSPAEKAGLKVNDVILKVDNKKMTDPNDLRLAVGNKKVNAKTKLHVLRDGVVKTINVKIGKRKVG